MFFYKQKLSIMMLDLNCIPTIPCKCNNLLWSLNCFHLHWKILFSIIVWQTKIISKNSHKTNKKLWNMFRVVKCFSRGDTLRYSHVWVGQHSRFTCYKISEKRWVSHRTVYKQHRFGSTVICRLTKQPLVNHVHSSGTSLSFTGACSWYVLEFALSL